MGWRQGTSRLNASELTGRIWGVVFFLEALPRSRSFLWREKRPRTVYPLASPLKGWRELGIWERESSNSGGICSDPKEGNRVCKTDSRDPEKLEKEWGGENWTRSCQMAHRLGKCQN